jgi:hypothetical protein
MPDVKNDNLILIHGIKNKIWKPSKRESSDAVFVCSLAKLWKFAQPANRFCRTIDERRGGLDVILGYERKYLFDFEKRRLCVTDFHQR